jgi:hypothetical protein
MEVSGNGNAASFFRSNGIRDLYIKTDEKYNSAAARQYKLHIKKLLATATSTLDEEPATQVSLVK